MTEPRQRTRTAWGRSSVAVSREWRIERREQAMAGLAAAGPRGVIATGLRRSYGDVGLNDGGDVLDLTPLSSITSFDAESGILCCDAGVSFEAIMGHCLPLGWQPPACPGTALVSMGGAVANDVHGKNQHGVGSFGDHVDWIEMLLPDGAVRRLDPASDPDLFAATVGGIGLTGVILSLQMRLMRVPSNAMELSERRVPDLDTFLELLTSSGPEWPYVVGWIDTLTAGRTMGRGILELARPSPRGVAESARSALNVPFQFPAWVLNRFTVGAFNSAYFHRIPSRGRTRRIHANRFLYPLDAIHNWNRMYGRRGMFQFQCAVPFSEGRRAIIELMEETIRSRGASFLAVLKAMGRSSRGMLSFPMPGFTLAIDFPRRTETARLIDRLYDIAIKYGGRVYLAKDACLTADRLRVMYPELQRFQDVLRRVDPAGIMQSDMSRRLHLNAR